MNYAPPPDKNLYDQQVWELVRQIPVGKVATYGQIMKTLSKPDGVSDDDYKISASRWVGSALSTCPQDVPWQRVINSQGKISHKSGAAEQKHLLVGEGVVITNEKINLDLYQWQGPGEQVEPAQGSLF